MASGRLRHHEEKRPAVCHLLLTQGVKSFSVSSQFQLDSRFKDYDRLLDYHTWICTFNRSLVLHFELFNSLSSTQRSSLQCFNKQKSEIQFVTKSRFSNLSRVNPLHKQINEGSLKEKIEPASPTLSVSSSCILDQCLDTQLQANATLAVSSLKCCLSSDVERRKHRENRWSCFWFGWSTLRVRFHQYLIQSGGADTPRVSGASGVKSDKQLQVCLNRLIPLRQLRSKIMDQLFFTLTLYWSFVMFTLTFTMFVHHFRRFPPNSIQFFIISTLKSLQSSNLWLSTGSLSYLLWQLPEHRQDVQQQTGWVERLDHVPEEEEERERRR